MKIKSIKRIPFKGTVYNLGVEEDKSYVANGIVVHNCRCTLIPITSGEIEDLKKKGEGVKVSTEDDIPPDFPDPGFKSFSEKNADVPITLPKDFDNHIDFLKWDVNSDENEGRYRLVDPKEFKPNTIRSWDEWAGIKTEGVRFIVGDLKESGEKAVQAVRFEKDKWSEDRATSWWNDHKDKFKKTWTQSDWDRKYEEFLRVEEVEAINGIG